MFFIRINFKNDTVYIAWEGVKQDNSRIFLAHRRAGEKEWSRIYQVSGGAWNTFYPMLTTDDNSLYVSWTERKGESSQIRLQTSPLAGS